MLAIQRWKHRSRRVHPSAGGRQLPTSNHGGHLQGQIHGCPSRLVTQSPVANRPSVEFVSTKPISVRPAMGGRQTFSGVIDGYVGECCPLPWSLRKAKG